MPERKQKTGTTPEAIEQEIISMAVDEIKKRISSGTASSQLLAIYGKEGTVKAQLERRKLEKELELLEAKTKALNDSADIKELTDEALKAFRKYSGADDEL